MNQTGDGGGGQGKNNAMMIKDLSEIDIVDQPYPESILDFAFT
jgi:hypothetical protein